jgi:hypothetical protein
MAWTDYDSSDYAGPLAPRGFFNAAKRQNFSWPVEDVGDPGQPGPAPDIGARPDYSGAIAPTSPRVQPNLQGTNEYQDYLDTGAKLRAALNPAPVSTPRALLGALVGHRNPQLGAVITGDYQRQRAIQPLMQQEEILGKQVGMGRQMEIDRIANAEKQAATGYYQAHANAITNPPMRPKEESWGIVPNVSGPNGELVEREQNSGQTRYVDLPGVKTTKTPTESAAADDQKYESIIQKQNLKHPITPEESAFAKAYEKRRTLGQTTTFNLNQPYKEQQLSRKDIANHDRDYVKPAEAVERSYQMYQDAQKAYNSGDTKTGAATMLALSQHIGTTFGQIKGSRQNKDLIQEHKDAIGLPDKIQRFAASIARGDQLSASQMKEFGDQIKSMRKYTWEITKKEGDRKGVPQDYMPSDLSGDSGGSGGVVRGPDGQIDWKKTLGL